MEAVPSTRHQKLKFPLESQSGRTDVITVRGDQHMARQCLLAVLPGEAEPSQVNVAELDREAELVTSAGLRRRKASRTSPRSTLIPPTQTNSS